MTHDTTHDVLDLLLLPERATAPAVRLRVGAGGRILSRQALDANTAGHAAHRDGRQVLAVPGSDCRVLWLRLPARSAAQALAAARLLVADEMATGGDALHLAIAPLPVPADQPRLVVALEPARMQAWLDRAAALGMTPDAVVPMPLLLPAPDTHDAEDGATEPGVTVGAFDGQSLVRGARLGFAAEPALAACVVDGQPQRQLDPAATEAALAAGALAPPVDLLQYGFATTPPRREGWQAWRRAAILAAAVAASPLVLLVAQLAHHELASRNLQEQARAHALQVLPDLPADADPVMAIRAQLADLEAGDRFARAAGTLLSAVAAVDGAELDALAYADGSVRATLSVSAPEALERIRTALAGAGLEMTETTRGYANGRVRHDVRIGPPA